MFRVTGLKILGRVGTHFFSEKKDNFMHFERHFVFQNAKNYIFFQKFVMHNIILLYFPFQSA